jgi:DNA polymerase V
MIYGLIDANSAYASMEQVVNPRLRAKPLCILSNNDGNVIARTPQAKALGVKMSQPAHELKQLVRDEGLILRSANFALYGDFHRRLVHIVRDMAPRVEVYSVDELFFSCAGIRKPTDFAHEMRDRILRWIGLPTSVGLGKTRGLAKTANRLSKKGEGVVDLTDQTTHAERLASLPISEVWGVGRKWEAKLTAIGITNALQLRDAPGELILERFGVVLRRTQRELAGHACMELQDVEPDRQQIVVSRSFGERVEDHAAVMQAIATFAVNACAKLRTRGLVTSAVWITANTDAFRPELPQHHPSRAFSLVAPTADTREVLRAIRAMSQGFLRKGFAYKRAGVAMLDLARPEVLQGDLFAPTTIGDDALMQVMDRVNQRFGRNTLGVVATGWRKAPLWRMRQQALTGYSTTNFKSLPAARC